ncbi:MAG: hypothetical protein DRJ05_15015 [Bacteroidetes bacterium]|nr:MAG: hypothetical protein DRJ05_15015 [Bacteroidota bacterium]
MKTVTIILTVVLFATISTTAQVAINNDGNAPDASAILDLQSNDYGFLPPRMKTSERDAIVTPAEGLTIYNITTECLEFYRSGIWIQLCGNSGTPENGAEYTIGSGGSCQNTIVAGYYEHGITLDGTNVITIDVLISVIGNGTVSTDTINGYSFSGSGNFVSTGVQQINLMGNGSPLAIQTDIFTATANHGGGTCTFSVIVNPLVPYVLNPTTGETWMDRNLGASQVATSSTDAAAYGDLYQWGRFTEGHEDRSSGNTTTNATTPVPDDGNIWDGIFITELSSPEDWLTPQDNTLWDGLSGTNNPCPPAYRIPTEAEWEAERLSWSTQDAAGAFNSPLKLTVAGGRNGSLGNINNEGSFGYYWSSSVIGTDSKELFFNSSSVTITNHLRADGSTVRCIRD